MAFEHLRAALQNFDAAAATLGMPPLIYKAEVLPAPHQQHTVDRGLLGPVDIGAVEVDLHPIPHAAGI